MTFFEVPCGSRSDHRLTNLTNVAQLPDTLDGGGGRVYVAGVEGSLHWAGSVRSRRIVAVIDLRRMSERTHIR